MRIEADVKLDYDDVLIRPKRSTLTSRKEVDLSRTISFLHSPKTWTGIPIFSANMGTCGTFEIAQVLSEYKMITALHKFYTIEQLKEGFNKVPQPDYLAYTLGIRPEDFEKLQQVIDAKLTDCFSFVCLDVPNGYLERFTESVKLVRKLLPQHILIAGNVVTNEMTEELLLCGADIVKVGIGPGSACLTRRMTGVGYPQLSAVIECSDAAHGIKFGRGSGQIIADGGLVHPACAAKAFCAGADYILSGTFFSGYLQSAGDLVEKDGKKYKQYYGSSSTLAMVKHYGKKDAHRASEGRELLIPYKGDLRVFLQELLGGLNSTATYIGAKTIKEFSRRATFIRVSRQLNTVHESHTVYN
jgi:GMP reductase